MTVITPLREELEDIKWKLLMGNERPQPRRIIDAIERVLLVIGQPISPAITTIVKLDGDVFVGDSNGQVWCRPDYRCDDAPWEKFGPPLVAAQPRKVTK